MRKLIFTTLLILVLSPFVAYAQEPAEPTGAADLNYGVDEATGVEITLDNGTTWTPVAVTFLGVGSFTQAQRKHKHFNWAGQPHNIIAQISESDPDLCVRVTIADSELSGIFLYRVRVRFFVYEPDGTPGIQSQWSDKSWWIVRVGWPGMVIPFAILL